MFADPLLHQQLGAMGYISSKDAFKFLRKRIADMRLLQQEARELHSVSALFLRKSARHSKDFFKTGPLQGFTSKEPGTSLIH